ncbi:MAG: CtsR family transcriptional regulator [Clostridiales bacterium]|nr:CtsR family transcriptional regulator [Clostridiales bacterium]
MNLSNMIAGMIMEMLEQDGETEIQRNELAEQLGVVPSQINYVIASRFTPEHGYTVESRRGGGGYIRITRVNVDKGTHFMHVINSIGDQLDEQTCRNHIYNLNYQNLIDAKTAKLILCATSDNCYREIPQENRDKIRANIFKNMLLNLD